MRLNSYRLAAAENRERLACGLGWFSIGLGLAQLFAPRALSRLIGVKPKTGLMPLLGLREIASGVGILTQPDKRPWLQSRVVGDMMDLALLGTAAFSEDTKGANLILATTAVAGVTALDVLCSREFAERAGMEAAASESRNAVHFRRSLIINRPPEELYKLWRDFEELPRFMHHVVSVRPTGEGRWHWTVSGPGGLRVEWDAEITEDRMNELIAWRSLPNADVDHSGTVSFERAHGNRGTIVRVEMHYRPPAGKAGARMVKFLGQAPEKQIAGDLLRFKQMVETGEIARTEGQPSGRARSTSRKFDDLVRA